MKKSKLEFVTAAAAAADHLHSQELIKNESRSRELEVHPFGLILALQSSWGFAIQGSCTARTAVEGSLATDTAADLVPTNTRGIRPFLRCHLKKPKLVAEIAAPFKNKRDRDSAAWGS